MDKIYDLAIAYPDFQLNQIIDPDQIDLNNSQVVAKINQIVKSINTFTQSTTGGAEVTIASLPEFPSAKNVQAALSQIATYCKTNNTSIAQIMQKDTMQDGEITVLKQRATNIESKNTAQDGEINALKQKATAIEGKNVEQDLRLNNMDGMDVIRDAKLLSLDNEKATKTEVENKLGNHVATGHDELYYRKNDVFTKKEIAPFIKGGDTNIKYEVYTVDEPFIEGLEGAQPTFTYHDYNNAQYVGTIGGSGEQIFELKQGSIILGLNRIEATINDTLTRSVASGGLIEVDTTHVALSDRYERGTEVTFKYYERLDIQGQYQVYVGDEQPPFTSNTIWIKTT